MQTESLRIQKFIFVIVGILLLGLVAYRAATLSFTHDESSTFFYFQHASIYDLFFSAEMWHSANNHLLNSILFQQTTTLLGFSDFTMRLPNVLAFFGLLVITYFFIFTKLTNVWARLFLVLILFINPYVIDFFSLCRGYGLSLFFHTATIFSLYIYLTEKKSKFLYIGFASLLFATLALLTNFILFPIYTLILWWVFYKEKSNRKHLIIAPVFFSVLTFLLIIKPVLHLRHANEFQYGSGSIWDSFKSLVKNSLVQEHYLGPYSADILTVFFMAGLLFILIRTIKKPETKFYAFVIGLLIIVLHILRFAMDIQFPTDRKTTMYIPLFAVFAATILQSIRITNNRKIILTVFSFLACVHFVYALNLHATQEWFYDRSTKNTILNLSDLEKKDVTLRTSWWLHPTSNYYLQTKGITNIKLLPYNKDLNTSNQPDYILCMNKEQDNFEGYGLIAKLNNLVLFKKK